MTDDRLVHPAGAGAAGAEVLARASGAIASVDAAGTEALMCAAAAAGHLDAVTDLILGFGDPQAWIDDPELVAWAADYGAVEVVERLITEAAAPARAALAIARAWLGTDPVAELRRRLGDPAGVPVTESVPVDRWTRADRVRVTAHDGRWAEIQTAHLAVAGYLEHLLDPRVSRDEQLARALTSGDADSANWSRAWLLVINAPDAEATYRWAAARLADPVTGVRRFAAEVIGALVHEERAFRADALEALRPRLDGETDPPTLARVINAYAEFYEIGTPAEIRAHAGHPDPRVRTQVAQEFAFALMAGPAHVPAELAALAGDPDDTVRAVALRALTLHGTGVPGALALFRAHRHDPGPDARVEALFGLALAGEPGADQELDRIAATAGPGSVAADRAGNAARSRRRAEIAPGL